MNSVSDKNAFADFLNSLLFDNPVKELQQDFESIVELEIDGVKREYRKTRRGTHFNLRTPQKLVDFIDSSIYDCRYFIVVGDWTSTGFCIDYAIRGYLCLKTIQGCNFPAVRHTTSSTTSHRLDDDRILGIYYSSGEKFLVLSNPCVNKYELRKEYKKSLEEYKLEVRG